MLTAEEIGNLMLSDAQYIYRFDVTADRVDDDIIDRDGYNYTRAAGLTAPFSFDEIIRRSFDTNYLDMQYTVESTTSELSCAAFTEAYNSGKRTVEATIFYPQRNIYNRLTYILKQDAQSGHIIAYVICRDVTDTEVYRLAHVESAQRALEETDSILASAGVGIWKIVLFDGEKPRMSANHVMRELLGITDPDISGEEIYERWHSGIKPSFAGIVQNGVSDMINLGKAEITYSWSHPSLGEIFVRCGGTAQYIEGRGHILRGYHSDVTEITKAEARTKQRLADALEETRRQKRMLQQALDNYHQADYDRRTDYLTGLRSRQDLFELLNDSQSEKRERISAVYMMDIDNFKMLNDHYGHLAGDACLQRIGKALTDYGREHSVDFYRYGGEEMLGIGYGGDAQSIAEGLVRLISGLNIERNDVDTGRVTVSLGYTADNKSVDGMIDMADKAMYHAKSHGKNHAACFEKL